MPMCNSGITLYREQLHHLWHGLCLHGGRKARAQVGKDPVSYSWIRTGLRLCQSNDYH